MNKNIKTVLVCLIIFLSLFFVFQKDISAEYSGTGGTGSGSVDAVGSQGTWEAKFGFYIKVYDSNNIKQGNTVDVPTAPSGWITKNNDDSWSSNPEKLYDYLDIPYGNVSGDYSTLLSKINRGLNIGDYITIEPYTMINGKKHTFREIIDSSDKYNKCTEMKCKEYECAEYNKTCNKYECIEYKCATYKCATYKCKEYKCATYECKKYKCTKKFLGICTKRSTTECETYSTTCKTYSSTCKTRSTTECQTYSTACKTYSSTCAKKACSSYKNTTTCKTYSSTCKTRSTTECAKTTPYSYSVWYARPAVMLSNAAKVGTTITVGNTTFTAPSSSCTKSSYDSNFCGYKSNKNIGYGITVVRYEDIYKNGKVKINIKNKDTNQPIENKNATFQIYDSTGKYLTDVTTRSGTTEYELQEGTYKIQQKTPPGSYSLASTNPVTISIPANEVTPVDFLYSANCKVDLEDLGSNRTPAALMDLYKKYKSKGENHTNLLNFSNPDCGEANCNKGNLQNSLSCLSGEQSLSTTFNENNLSCFDGDPITKDQKIIGFCSDYFKLTNNLGTNKFYGISGQFLIRQDNNVLTIYNNNLDPVKINSQYIATSTNGKICYILTGNTYNLSSNIQSNNVYFGDSNMDSDVSIGANTSVNLGTFTKYTYELVHNYKLSKKIYLEKITGKFSSTKTEKTTQNEIYGILSKFNETEGIISFKLTYGGVSYEPKQEKLCKYETTSKLINKNQLELEYRIVDTSDPFVNRNTNTNWCDETGNCESNNNRVQIIIKERNNSYDQTGEGPKYRIKLTSSDIILIRKYNEEHKYDNYQIYCDADGKCKNSFIYDLINGELNKYVDNKPVYKYGNLKFELEV